MDRFNLKREVIGVNVIQADVVPVDREKFEYLKEVEIRLGMILDYLAEEDMEGAERGALPDFIPANELKRMAGYYPDSRVIQTLKMRKEAATPSRKLSKKYTVKL